MRISDWSSDVCSSDLKLKLRGLVESAVNVVNLYSKMEADGTLTPEEARRQAKNTLYGMNFDGKNYFFVVDTDGVLVAHPNRQEQIGLNMVKQEDPVARKNYETFLAAAHATPTLDARTSTSMHSSPYC